MSELKIFGVAGCAAALALFSAAGSGAFAQTWPTQRVTLVVPYAPGGTTDIVARLLQPAMEKMWNQPFIIENRPGAGSLVGTATVAKAAPDGYTLLFNGNGVVSSRLFVKNMPYDPADLRPVVELANTRYLISVTPQSGIKSIAELVAYAKKNPKAIHYGVIPMSNQALDNLDIQRRLGVQFTEIGYNSQTQMMTALLRNELQFSMGGVTASVAAPLVKEGKLTVLAVIGNERNSLLPDAPTTKELGLDFDYGFDFGIWMQTKMPPALLSKIGGDFAAVVRSPEWGAHLKKLSYNQPTDPLAWPAAIDAVMRKYTELVKQVGIQPQ